ncbi:MAG: hypothetical protein MUQ32_02220 [Chloroflexi bacterium]|nr:hypothetical protein [Chloroflexota bacterium]
MQDTDLFLSLAEIAGVFVGFGALISVRSGGASDATEVTYIRDVVSIAIWVVVAALAPITLGSYGLAGHELWLVCSLLTLVLIVGLWAVNIRTPESREDMATYSRADRIRMVATFWPPSVLMIAALVLVMLGLFPAQESALYLTAVVLGLFLTAATLLDLVLSQRRTQRAPDPAAQPATGGSSA